MKPAKPAVTYPILKAQIDVIPYSMPYLQPGNPGHAQMCLQNDELGRESVDLKS